MFFIAAMGKSAQLFLHTWLPDAMEGPTPVSALIHAATMVTAGVFLIIRCSFIFEYSEFVLVIVLLFGGLTAFFAATSGLVQYDLKKVIAYSTCSQLGYMVFSCGLSSYNVAMFHLANHAFFKALLFLSAGSVIHALNNEQDMRRMGGLIRILPFSYVMFLIGSLALAGFPFLTGYYSKDVILEIAAVNYSVGGLFVYWLGVFSAFLTAFYSFRLIYLTFFATTNNFKKQMSEAHESSFYMTTPLIILGIGSIFIGFLNKDLIIGLGSISFSNSIFISFNHLKLIDSEFLPTSVKLIPFFFSCFGIFSALFLNYFYRRTIFYFKVHKFGNIVFTFLSKKWYFDSIYNTYISLSFLKLGYNVSYKLLDQGLIEYVGPTGISRVVPEIAKVVNKISTGYIYHYAFLMILGLLFFFFIIFVDFNFLILFFDLRLIILIFFLL